VMADKVGFPLNSADLCKGNDGFGE
jgi:hypothetical protein